MTPNTDALPPRFFELLHELAETGHISGAGVTSEAMTRVRAALAAQQGAQVPTVTDAMVAAYLTANDAYWREVDALPSDPTKPWRQGTPKHLASHTRLA